LCLIVLLFSIRKYGNKWRTRADFKKLYSWFFFFLFFIFTHTFALLFIYFFCFN
jgi:hypothetical protein